MDRLVRWQGAVLPMGLTSGPGQDLYVAGQFGGTVTFGAGPDAPSLTHQCSGRGGSGFLVRVAGADASATWARAAQGCFIDQGLIEGAAGRVVWVQTHGDGTITFDGGSAPPITFPRHGVRNVSLATYSSDGDLLWAGDTAGEGLDKPADLALGADGSVYLVGTYSSNPIVFGPGVEDVTLAFDPPDQFARNHVDGFVAKWAPDGALAWAVSLTGDGSQLADGVAVTADGTVVVVGDFSHEMVVTPAVGPAVTVPPSDLRVGFALGFSPAGELRWSQRWGNTVSGYDEVEDAVVANGTALVVGYADRDPSFGPVWPTPVGIVDPAPFQAAWRGDGTLDRVLPFPDLSVWDIDADPAGRMALAGMVPRAMTFGVDGVALDPLAVGHGDPAVATFAPDGSEECIWPILSDRDDFYEHAAAVALDSEGGVWATGAFEATLTFVPGTPEETPLTQETGEWETWIARFRIARP